MAIYLEGINKGNLTKVIIDHSGLPYCYKVNGNKIIVNQPRSNKEDQR